MNRALLAAALATVAGGCHAPRVATALPVTEQVVPIADTAGAVVELGDATFIFTPSRALVVRRGVVTATAEGPGPGSSGTPGAWTGAAAAIAAPDGEGRWAVGVDRDGKLWHVTLGGEIEPVSDRLGLGDSSVHALDASGKTLGAALARGVAFSRDGTHTDITFDGAPTRIAAARHRLALTEQRGGVAVWDLDRQTSRSYHVDQVTGIGFLDAESDHARLVIGTPHRVYVEDGGALAPVATPAEIYELVTTGAQVWARSARGILVLDRGAWMVTSARHAAGRMFASHTGVWLDDARGSMFHYQIDAGADRWQAQVAPVFQRVCAHCHLPDGEAGIDLSTVASWNRARGEIVHRVLETRTMPPAGTELSDADRNALAAWLGVTP